MLLLDILLYSARGRARWEVECISEWLGVGARFTGISHEDLGTDDCEFERSI
jgi:hypothetical protein